MVINNHGGKHLLSIFLSTLLPVFLPSQNIALKRQVVLLPRFFFHKENVKHKVVKQLPKSHIANK